MLISTCTERLLTPASAAAASRSAICAGSSSSSNGMPISAGGRVVIGGLQVVRDSISGGLRSRRGNATRLGGSERWEAEMAEMPLSSTETTLENQPIGGLQL